MKEKYADFLKQLALKPGQVELRGYQVEMAERVLRNGNSLVIMPTALGKTYVAAFVIAKFLKEERSSLGKKKKILFLTPTKPLALQQSQRLREWLEFEGTRINWGKEEATEVMVLSGETEPALRERLWANPILEIVCATPQTVEYDLLAGRVSMEAFRLVVFDEVHRAVKEHSYAFLAKEAAKQHAFILGLTASPSSKREVIQEICTNLNIANIEVRDENDKDVQGYAKPVKLDWIFVELPKAFMDIKSVLEELLKDALAELLELEVVDSTDLKRHKRALLDARRKALELSTMRPEGYRALSVQARAMNVSHALDLLETEGIHALWGFMQEMGKRKQKSKAVKGLLQDFRWKLIGIKCEELRKQGVEHPKFRRLKGVVSDAVQEGKSVIVFAHYRNTVTKIVEELNQFAGVKAKAFVGKSKEGMNQKKQAQVLQEFKSKSFNVLVATSVAEEGIDVPSVDLVVFFEAVPSEIRAIQRRGRTGRVREGNTIVLITRKSKDEAFFWISKQREKKMRSTLHELRKELKSIGNKEQIGVEEQEELIVGNQKNILDF
ncbi:DEAD/DEAH box helicase [Candidatus Micrarchaeota archaeon]|nr:DEAD/DEAH box helicase [Candidatus Micrarchaeota archaeon]